MHKFWSWLGLNLGKHWIIVLTIGAVLTVGLGYGITKLEFSTGQDSYLNKSDQVYKDNVAYQHLFGGQAMLTLVTMDEGHTVERALHARERSPVARGREGSSVKAATSSTSSARSPRSSTTTRSYGARPATRPRASPAKILLGAVAREQVAGGSGGAQRRRGADADAAERDPAGAASARQPDVRRLPHPRQPRKHPQAARARSSSTTVTRRW